MTRETKEPTENYRIILRGMDAYKVEADNLERTLFEIATAPDMTITEAKALAKEAISNIGFGAAESKGAEELRIHLKLNANNIRRNKERQRVKRGQPPQSPILAPLSDDELAKIESDMVPDEEFERIAKEQGWIK